MFFIRPGAARAVKTVRLVGTQQRSSLLAKSDFELEGYGRLTHPLVYDRDSDTLRPVAWEQAFARIGEILRGVGAIGEVVSAILAGKQLEQPRRFVGGSARGVEFNLIRL